MFQKNVREERIYQMIEDEILGILLPIKPNRSFERKKFSLAHFLMIMGILPFLKGRIV